MKKLLESYWQMPRAGKWGVWFAVVMVLYFGAIEPYINFMNSVTVEADRIEARLRQRASLKDRLENNRAMIDAGIAAFGTPDLPQGDDRLAALDRKLSAVLNGKTATEKRRLTRDNLTPLTLGVAQKVTRVGKELQLECETAELMTILRELELAPEVSAVSRLDVRRISEVNPKTGGGVLSVTIVVEAWAIAPDGATTAKETPAATEGNL